MSMLSDNILFGIIGILIVVEVLVLLVYWFIFKRGIAPVHLLGNVASGGCLIAALWVSQSPDSKPIVLCLLLLSLLFHVFDLLSRWQSRSLR